MLRHQNRILLLDSPFDDELDEYPDAYKVYELPDSIEPTLAVGPWRFLADPALKPLGAIQIKDVKFDQTRRAKLDATVLDPLLRE